MAAFQPAGWWSSGSASYNITYTPTTTDNTTLLSQQPFLAVPVTPVEAPPDDSPLTWLRSQVAEVCELAHAA